MGGSEGTSNRLLCIGDIHACAAELAVLLEAVAPTTDDQLVFLGDYVDRCPGAREVLDLLIDLRSQVPDTVFLRGNHEQMMLGFLGLGGGQGEIFLRAGGVPTLRSYGLEVRPGEPPSPSSLRARMPDEHVEFLTDGLRLFAEFGPYAFVHAGVRPGIPLEQQHPDDILWIRDEFLSAEHGLDRTVVFGHTPQREAWLGRGRKIGLDTGCVYGGRLSCLDITGAVIHQVTKGERTSRQRSVLGDLIRVG